MAMKMLKVHSVNLFLIQMASIYGKLPVDSVPATRAFANNNKKLLRINTVVISDGALSQGLQTPSFWNIRRAFIEHKRTINMIKAIKTICFAFVQSE